MSEYEKVTLWEFTAADEEFFVTYFSSVEIYFEEKRKNGQEDCHIYGVAYHADGKWKLRDDTVELLEMYRSPKTAQDLIDFFNTHGVPENAEAQA